MELLKFDEASDFISLPLYPLSKLHLYNIRKSCENLLEEIDKFIDLQCKYLNVMPPRITSDYKLVYTVHKVSDKVSDNVCLKLDLQDEIKLFYNKLARALQLLSHDEMVYFNDVIYHKNSERQCVDNLNITPYYLRHIKESCIIKMSKALGCAVLK